MSPDEARSLARKWEIWIAEMRGASSIRDLDAMLQRARGDRQMPRQVLQHIEHVTYAETRASLKGRTPPSPRPSRKDQAAGEAE